ICSRRAASSRWPGRRPAPSFPSPSCRRWRSRDDRSMSSRGAKRRGICPDLSSCKRSRFLVSLGAAVGIGCLLAAATAAAQNRAIPFWDDKIPNSIHAETDGVATLETVRELGRYHRVQGSPGFAAATEVIRHKAAAAGLSDAAVEHFPADGKTTYAHLRSYFGWKPDSARLDEVAPRARLISSFPEYPVALADYSQDADVTADLVDVGKGTEARDYEGLDIRNKIVLADGDLPAVHQKACEERGAAGFLSAFPHPHTP